METVKSLTRNRDLTFRFSMTLHFSYIFYINVKIKEVKEKRVIKHSDTHRTEFVCKLMAIMLVWIDSTYRKARRVIGEPVSCRDKTFYFSYLLLCKIPGAVLRVSLMRQRVVFNTIRATKQQQSP